MKNWGRSHERRQTIAAILPAADRDRPDPGLKVFAVRRPELPLINIHLVVPRGAETDPPGKAGLASLAAEMLTLGAGKRSALQLAAEIDGMGAAFSAHAEWDGTAVNLSGLSEDWERLLELLLEICAEPAFAPEEFEQLKKRRIASLVQQKDESQIIADERIQQLLFRGTPYEHPAQGTFQSLPPLQNEEARDAWRTDFMPPGTMIVMVGDLEAERFARWVETHFPSGSSVEQEERWTPAIPAGPRIHFVDRPELTQSQIRLGHLSLAHRDPDFLPFEVMSYILGAGGFSSRLMKRIRSELGYTYGIRGALEPRRNPGPFLVSTFTPTATTFPCVREIFAVINDFLEGGATEPERQEAVQFLTGSYPLRFETLSQTARRIVQAELHGLGLESLTLYPGRIAAVSLEEINRVSRARLHPQEMGLVVVGRTETFKTEFAALGPAQTLRE